MDKKAQFEMEDYKNDAKNIENATANDPLARYSDAEKTKALRKLDWNLIPLYEFPSDLQVVERQLSNKKNQAWVYIHVVLYRPREYWKCLHGRNGQFLGNYF